MMSTREEYYSQGLNRFAKMESDEAIAAFKMAIDLDANYADAYLALAQAYDQKGMVDDAITTIKRAIELDPKEPLYHTSLSVFFRKKGMIPEAEAEMAQAMALQRGS
jgi:Flp pilus assembly protein TadD